MGKERKKKNKQATRKITLSLRNAPVLRKVAAFSENTCSELVDTALDEWFERQVAEVEPSEEDVQEMVAAARVASSMGRRKEATPQGNSVVQDALRASRAASGTEEE